MPWLPMATPAVIIDLRKALSERFPQRPAPAASVLTTGLSFLHQTRGCGVLRSAFTEYNRPRASTGSAPLIHARFRSAKPDRHLVPLTDVSDSVDPHRSATAA